MENSNGKHERTSFAFCLGKMRKAGNTLIKLYINCQRLISTITDTATAVTKAKRHVSLVNRHQHFNKMPVP